MILATMARDAVAEPLMRRAFAGSGVLKKLVSA
jgi:hypothetical protein